MKTFAEMMGVALYVFRLNVKRKSSAPVLSTHTPELFATAVARAVELLQTGAVVALPTETVYGLATNAWNAPAVARIFAIKGRPANNPLIVHVASLAMARQCAASWPESAERLAAAFWPGPLTLVLPRADTIPPEVTAGGSTVAVRWPSHPFIQAVIRACGFPLAAPSANLSSQISPTTAQHVAATLGDKIPLIVDGGPCQVGIESTVLDLGSTPPRILRPGMVHGPAIAAVLKQLPASGPKQGQTQSGGILPSPGLLPRHYAPRARLVILRWRDDADLRDQLRLQGIPPEDTHLIAHSVIPGAAGFAGVTLVPHDPVAYARALYAELHRCDAKGARWIVVEWVPDAPEWDPIRDRLRRAAAGE